MDPFLGVPMVQTPPAEIRQCLRSQLGLDVEFNSDTNLPVLDTTTGRVSNQELAIAQRYCSTLE